jgi:nicotinamidase-related amidase
VKHIERDRSVLVLVDYQQRLMPTIHDADSVVDEAVFLAHAARRLGVRVLGTEQNPAGLGPSVPQVRELCERTLAKMHFDACRDGLLDALRDANAGPVVIAGCEAHVCLCQTALGLLGAGLDLFVVAQACGSRRPEDRALAMQRLAQAGAAIVSAEMVVFEWLGSCESPSFKPVLALLKERAASQAARG